MAKNLIKYLRKVISKPPPGLSVTKVAGCKKWVSIIPFISPGGPETTHLKRRRGWKTNGEEAS